MPLLIRRRGPCSTLPDQSRPDPSGTVTSWRDVSGRSGGCHQLEIVPSIGSTNAVLLQRLAAGETTSENHWLIADRQTAGRGRAGRSWFDGHGNFMGSTVAQVLPSDSLPHTLSLVAGIAVHRAVSSLMVSDGLFLKWPNDLLYRGKKLAGILLERQGQNVVVGIGVNIAVAPQVADRQTTSLLEQGCTIERDAFAHLLADHWSQVLNQWHSGMWNELRGEWLRRAHPVGTMVSVKDSQHGELIGTFARLGEDGTAYLRLADGQRHAIHAGDIEMVG